MAVLVGNSLPVPTGAVTVTVSGVFPLPYQVAPSPSWPTEAPVTGKTASQFVVTFTVPAPDGATLDYIVFSLDVPVATGPGLLAGTIITNVRDEIPDPAYLNGVPQPDADGGLLRAQTLYRWLDDGVRIMARLCGSVIEDWTAIAQTLRQPWYALDAHFQTIADAFSNQYRISRLTAAEGDFIWPSTGVAPGQSLWGYQRKRTDHLEFGLWPVPRAADPVTTLAGAMGTGDLTLSLAAATGFLSFGYVQIDSEIIQYQQVVGSGLQVLSRGVCGTSPASHLLGAAVLMLGLWIKGTRSPAAIVNSLSVVELPLDIVSLLETYLLARARGAENEFEERARLMKEFETGCAGIRADPTRKQSQAQMPMYGEATIGPLYHGGRLILP